jgi:hypothetical protein
MLMLHSEYIIMNSRLLLRLGIAFILALASVFAVLAATDDAFEFPFIAFDHKAIHYGKEVTDDPIARLQKKLDSGEVKLAYEPNRWGYLRSLLKNLGVNIDSQMLVLSKTSFQGSRISPQSPRALYFNDSVAIGYVQGSDITEVLALDPKQGAVFYTLDNDKTAKPSFLRRTDACLSCHLGPPTQNVPGLLVTSVVPSTDGSIRFPAASLITDHRSSLDQRWGGWYVTGTGPQHKGNAVAPRPDQPSVLDRRNSQDVTSLVGRFDTTAYLAPTSDIVALMTLEHQTRMTNLMIRIGWEARIAIEDGKTEQFHTRLTSLAGQVVDYMLFAEEAKIWQPIQGVSTFTATFPQRGPHDKLGRSLREFDLNTRMFKYPLSYMIYSEAFDNMPLLVRDEVFHQLYEVLSERDKNPIFARLSEADRRAILEILRDTKPNLPAYWKADPGPAPGN